MAVIEGLQEQKNALTRVKHNIKEIKNINESLQNIRTYLADATKKEYKLECEFGFKDDSLKRIKIPITLNEDNEFIYNALKSHKADIVKKVREDSSKYHISLNEQEESLLAD